MKPTVETKETYLEFVKNYKETINTLAAQIRYERYDAPAPSKERYEAARNATMEAAAYLGAAGNFLFTRRDGSKFLIYINKYSYDSRLVTWLIRLRREFKIKAAEAYKLQTV
jgi:hypothetical protein